MYQTGVKVTYIKYVLIINNETKINLLLPMVAEFWFMWFPNVFFAILLRRGRNMQFNECPLLLKIKMGIVYDNGWCFQSYVYE